MEVFKGNTTRARARFSTQMFKLLSIREGHIGAHHIILSIFL